MRPLLATAFAILALSTPWLAWAKNPTEQVHAAAFIFAGTVEAVDQADPSLVRVTFTQLSFAKGKSDARALTISVPRDPSGGFAIRGEHRFRVGNRYLLLAASELGGADGRSIVGDNLGYFQIADKGPNHARIVYDWRGFPIAWARNGHYSVVGWRTPRPRANESQPPKPSKSAEIAQSGAAPTPIPDSDEDFILTTEDPGTRVSESEFLKFLSRLAK